MGDAPPAPAATEDPLAADKRTLTISAIAMVGLILVGVVSAQLFARGGCGPLPEPRRATTAGAPGPGATDVLAEQFGRQGADRVAAAVEAVAGTSVAAAHPVGDAMEVARLEEGLVATGGTVTSFDEVAAPRSTYDGDGGVVGDGATVYDTALVDDATGQIDAFVPVTGTQLQQGGCVDTARVGAPFAFVLGAGDGELLLLRAEEDGGSPELELRTDAGPRWELDLDLPAGSPGTLAERASAGLGPDRVVLARRVGPQETDEHPAALVVGRDDGSEVARVDHDRLAAATSLDPEEPIRWQVAAVGTTTALLHGRPDPSDAAGGTPVLADGALVLLVLDDGAVAGSVTGVGPLTAAAVAPPGPDTGSDRYAVATRADGGEQDEVALLTAEGTRTSLELSLDGTRLAWHDGSLVVAGDGTLARVDAVTDADGDPTPTIAPLPATQVRDVATTTDGRLAVLVGAADAGPSVLVVTGPAAVAPSEPAEG